MNYIIGIDIGTGSTKAVAVSTKGEVLCTSQVSYPTLNPKPGYSEQAPELIWQAFIKCIVRVVNQLHHQPKGIALSSAMHSVIGVDENGQALMNMITWADNRSALIAEKIKASSSGEMLYEQTGTPIHPMSPLCKIIWLRENEPGLFQQIHKFISIKEYIWFKLFSVFEIDHSIASATGLFDIERLVWNENALQQCEISADKLSQPVSTSHMRSEVLESIHKQLGIDRNISFIIGGSDGCMANVGSFAIEPGIAALTIGTSGAIRVANATSTIDIEAMPFNYRLDENTFVTGGPINNGGIALKWYVEGLLKKKLQSSEDYDAILNETKTIAPGSNGLIFLPYLLGERAPLWNSEACGVFFGIDSSHTQMHFTRAVMEGILFALYNVCKTMEESGLLISEIHVSGGFVHSEIWLQLLADIFGKKIVLIRAEDASAQGAAFLAMKKLKLIDNYNVLMPASVTAYHPNNDHHILYSEKIFPVFRNLSKNMMLDMAVLHDMKTNLQNAYTNINSFNI
ncbi:MAG: gluconokinase [Chryseolinea sp.]